MRDEEVRDAFKDFVLDLLSFSFTGTVESVDEESLTATVKHNDISYTANFKSIQDSKTQGLWIVPTVGSDVFCVPEGQSKERFMIVKYSQIERIYFEVGETKCNVTSDQVKFNDGENGGLAITPGLVSNLGKLTARVDGIINAITNAAVTAGDGGAVLKTNIVTALSALSDKEDFTAIENTKIVH